MQPDALAAGAKNRLPDDGGAAGCRRRLGVVSARQLTDDYLLLLAVKRGGRLVTFDTAITVAAVAGATPQHVVTL